MLEKYGMYYIDPPPEGTRVDENGQYRFPTIEIHDKNNLPLSIRKARVSDVKGIMKLVNGFATSKLMLSRGPQYIYENIRDFIVIFLDADGDARKRSDENVDGELIIACGGLHVLWGDMAEIRSTAVHPDFQCRGLGSRLVKYMKEDARRLGIAKLFTFTLAEGFFRSLGFEVRNRDQLPHVVWAECSRCPKYFKCDEIGMMLDL